eukprot:scaffold50794_cov68-Phaeocystis_antarctica.AAC.7
MEVKSKRGLHRSRLGHLLSLLMLERPAPTGRAETAARQAGRERCWRRSRRRSWQRSWCIISCGRQRDRVRQASGLLLPDQLQIILHHLVDDQLQIHGLVSRAAEVGAQQRRQTRLG